MKNRLIVRVAFGIVLLAIVFSMASSSRSDGDYITGVVTAPSRRPLASAWVIISQNGYEKGRSLTGDDGTYYISNLSAGTYNLIVYSRNRQLAAEQVNLPGDSNHNVLIR
jgi:hypothetical protein